MLFDFRCENVSCREVHEEWVSSQTLQAVCPKCYSISRRIVSPVKCVLDPISGDFPGATMKWVKDHEEGAKRKE